MKRSVVSFYVCETFMLRLLPITLEYMKSKFTDMKVKTDKYGIIHAYAQCNDCDWDGVMNINAKNRMQKLRNEIYYHVEKTGHKITLETGNSTDYYRE